jgi:chromosome segregation ATPase
MVVKSEKTREAMQRHVEALQADIKAIEDKASPLRAKRDALAEKLAPIEAEMRTLQQEIKTLEQPEGEPVLYNLKMELGAIARGMGGKSLQSAPEKPESKT